MLSTPAVRRGGKAGWVSLTIVLGIPLVGFVDLAFDKCRSREIRQVNRLATLLIMLPLCRSTACCMSSQVAKLV